MEVDATALGFRSHTKKRKFLYIQTTVESIFRVSK